MKVAPLEPPVALCPGINLKHSLPWSLDGNIDDTENDETLKSC